MPKPNAAHVDFGVAVATVLFKGEVVFAVRVYNKLAACGARAHEHLSPGST